LSLSSGQVAAGDILLGGLTAYGPAAAAAAAALALGVQILPTGAFGYLPVPTSITPAQPQVPGYVNTRDLDQAQFFELMKMGLLLDIAHMGQKTASTALGMAQKYHYPLMDSHTGIRCDNSPTQAPTTGFPAA